MGKFRIISMEKGTVGGRLPQPQNLPRTYYVDFEGAERRVIEFLAGLIEAVDFAPKPSISVSMLAHLKDDGQFVIDSINTVADAEPSLSKWLVPQEYRDAIRNGLTKPMTFPNLIDDAIEAAYKKGLNTQPVSPIKLRGPVYNSVIQGEAAYDSLRTQAYKKLAAELYIPTMQEQYLSDLLDQTNKDIQAAYGIPEWMHPDAEMYHVKAKGIHAASVALSGPRPMRDFQDEWNYQNLGTGIKVSLDKGYEITFDGGKTWQDAPNVIVNGVQQKETIKYPLIENPKTMKQQVLNAANELQSHINSVTNEIERVEVIMSNKPNYVRIASYDSEIDFYPMDGKGRSRGLGSIAPDPSFPEGHVTGGEQLSVMRTKFAADTIERYHKELVALKDKLVTQFEAI